MGISLKAYTDLSLATELTQVSFEALLSGATGDLDTSFALGLAGSLANYQASSDPGVDQIVLSISDANPASEVDTSNIKLALSSGGLASATAGAALNLGVNLPAAGVLIYVRSDTPAFTSPNNDITLNTNTIVKA